MFVFIYFLRRKLHSRIERERESITNLCQILFGWCTIHIRCRFYQIRKNADCVYVVEIFVFISYHLNVRLLSIVSFPFFLLLPATCWCVSQLSLLLTPSYPAIRQFLLLICVKISPITIKAKSTHSKNPPEYILHSMRLKTAHFNHIITKEDAFWFSNHMYEMRTISPLILFVVVPSVGQQLRSQNSLPLSARVTGSMHNTQNLDCFNLSINFFLAALVTYNNNDFYSSFISRNWTEEIIRKQIDLPYYSYVIYVSLIHFN